MSSSKKSYPFNPAAPAAKKIIAFLLCHDRHMKNAEIAQALGLRSGTVKTAISALAKLGYLEKVARVTDKGRALLAQSS